MKSKSTRVERVKQVMDILQAVAVIAGVIIGLNTLNETQKIESAKFIREIERDLDNSKYDKIASAIKGEGDASPISGKVSILIKSGGHFSPKQLSDYLDNYEEVGILKNEELVTDDIVDAEFGYDIEKIWCNVDIHNYIKDLREKLHSQDYYSNVQDLAETFLKKDGYFRENDYEASCLPLDSK